jgi:hypothetical protein
LGVTSEVSISYIGRSPVNDYWAVPKIGEQIVVSADDSNMTNVFWLQTEPYNSEGIASQTGEPMGFANRLDSVITFNNTTRVFTISPVDGSYDVWVRGVLYTITEPISITIPSGHGGYNVYFDITGTLQVKTPYFDLEYEAPVSFIYWNTVSAIMFADERHGITLDWATHEYLHRTRGAAIASGFEVSGYTTTGTGNTVADGKITIANGTFFDEDLQIDITHSATPVAETWQQRLQSGAYIPVYYKDSAGWQKATTTQYPLKFGTTYPQYNLNASSLVEMNNNRYGIAWIVATNGLTEPVISVMGQAQYSNIADAHAALWSNVTMTGFPSFEFRPLWKVIFQAQNGSAIKAAIRAIDDLRTFQGTAASGGTSVTSLENLVDVTLTSPTANQTLLYNGSQWVNAPATVAPATMSQSGISGWYGYSSYYIDNNFNNTYILQWESSGSISVLKPGFISMIVVGGGGGGGSLGGGGGGGAVHFYENIYVNQGTIYMFIGSGGAGGTNMGQGYYGGYTTVDLPSGSHYSTILAAGGGGGGGYSNGVVASSAFGSTTYAGAGAGGNAYPTYQSLLGAEYALSYGGMGHGGYAYSGNPYAGGGGGGCRGSGKNASTSGAGDGGAGFTFSNPRSGGIFNLGAGGGGSYHGNYAGPAGRAGAGAVGGRGSGGANGIPGLSNTGTGGGGGGYQDGTFYSGGTGGSGTVILIGSYWV